MINLFRTIRNSMLKENKTSKYLKYALGEIILVVIGILIAVKINNWNNQRQEDAREQKILQILKSEFDYNKTELKRNIEKATRLMNRADTLLMLFDEPRDFDNAERLIMLMGSLSAYSTFDPSNGALTNLISSGELNLIKNDSLRITLSKWFGEVQDVKEDEMRLMDYGDLHLEPLRIEYSKYKKDSHFNRNTTDILDNPKFENIVTRMWKATDYIIQNYEILGLEIDEILGLINQEIIQ